MEDSLRAHSLLGMNAREFGLPFFLLLREERRRLMDRLNVRLMLLQNPLRGGGPTLRHRTIPTIVAMTPVITDRMGLAERRVE